jgi:hypothetical protein
VFFDCQHYDEVWLVVRGIYTCKAAIKDFSNETTLIAVTGNHIIRKSISDVEALLVKVLILYLKALENFT